MPFEITMPQLGLTMEKGTVVDWLAGEGDQISIGQEIFQVETDKSIVAVEAHVAGTLARILVGAGQEVAVGAVLAVSLAPGETLPVDWQPSHPAGAPAQPAAASQPAPVPPEAGAGGTLEASWKARVLARQAGLDLATLVGQGPGGRIIAADIVGAAGVIGAADVEVALANREAAQPTVRATPVAANLAEALGLDLVQVRGSGPDGRIDQQDVLAAAAALIRHQATALPTREPGFSQVRSTPLQGVRKIVSEGMASSVHTTARVTLFREVDASQFIRLRERFVAQGTSVSYNDLLIHFCAVALREHPAANARLGDGQIEHLDRVNIGLAVDTERGLLVPVVHDADRMTLPQIAAETARLVAAARSGRIPPNDLSGGTFTVTNLGMFGVEGFTPVINLPECCILGVGKMVRKPVVIDDRDTVAVRPTMILSLVFDHRVIDGAPAARFLDRIAQLVEDPMLLLTRE
ncbi:MAG TPA: dihydrolipoamide acetyltransferase family protein [Anaerolineae bacterium]|nr:dihydrolipoamide acetyltransferase family protein [Anaerolineae bacterium]